MQAPRIPRRRDDDYTRDAAEERRRFIQEQTGTDLAHVGAYSFDPAVLPGNIENFTGIVQMPLGFAG
ncbi:MAG: hydroxymethylglutaryl-CoA reductase, partial [Halioglobus sp.]